MLPVMRVMFGPQHPITGQAALFVDFDGDLVVGVEPDVGYTHRGIEKLAENRTYLTFIPPLERVNIADGPNMVLGYVEAVEELMGVKVPERAQFIRVITAEMSRIISHLYWLCLMSSTVGLETVIMWTVNDRELFLDLFEMYTGARLTHSYMVPGGVRADLPEGFREKAFKTLDYLERRLKDYYRMLYENYTFRIRSIGVGKLKPADAVKLGVVGPTLRGSGLKVDVRKDEPYEVYGQLDFIVPTEEDGDSYARSLVRYHEMEQSISIIRQALDKLPEGPIRVKVGTAVPKGEVYSRVEAARGELGYHLVGDGGDRPYRVKISAPSFRNLTAVGHLIKDVPFADIPVILWSLDPWWLGVDR